MSEFKLSKKNKDHQIFALQRYFCWACSFKRGYQVELPNYSHLLEERIDCDPDESLAMFFVSPAGRDMMFWCSMLYVVYEGWKVNCGFSDPEIGALEDERKLKLLKEFRNATFHYQKDYFTPKYFKFMGDPDAIDWTLSLHAALEKFFQNWQKGHGVVVPS
jgi:hypothetical protein